MSEYMKNSLPKYLIIFFGSLPIFSNFNTISVIVSLSGMSLAVLYSYLKSKDEGKVNQLK